MSSTGVAWAPGSCGELVQGWYRGRWLQVTCPVAMGSGAEVRLGEGKGDLREPARPRGGPDPVVRARPPAVRGRWKARQAMLEILVRLGARGGGGRPVPGALRLASLLPPGKGLGGSTADVVAAAAAAARASGYDPTAEVLADVALSVEPSDGTMLPGIALFDHVHGAVREELGPPPPLRVLVVDPGGSVDTLRWHAGLGRGSGGRASAADVERWRRAFEDVVLGVRTGDVEAVGRGATESARLHGERCCAPLFYRVEQVAREVGALGVNAAHSGTVFGLLLSPDGPDRADARERVRRAIPDARVCETVLVSGGVSIPAGDRSRGSSLAGGRRSPPAGWR